MEKEKLKIHPAISSIYQATNDLGFSCNESDAHEIWNAVKKAINYYDVRNSAEKVVSLRFEGTNDETELYKAICELEKQLNKK